jgi:hypothetical protein
MQYAGLLYGKGVTAWKCLSADGKKCKGFANSDDSQPPAVPLDFPTWFREFHFVGIRLPPRGGNSLPLERHPGRRPPASRRGPAKSRPFPAMSRCLPPDSRRVPPKSCGFPPKSQAIPPIPGVFPRNPGDFPEIPKWLLLNQLRRFHPFAARLTANELPNI